MMIQFLNKTKLNLSCLDNDEKIQFNCQVFLRSSWILQISSLENWIELDDLN